jgi:hypothetical protein
VRTGIASCGRWLPSTRTICGCWASPSTARRIASSAALQDVQGVDLGDARRCDAEADRALPDLAVEALALLGRQQLRVVEAADRPLLLEDHGGGDDRAGERAAADLVDAGHQPGDIDDAAQLGGAQEGLGVHDVWS